MLANYNVKFMTSHEIICFEVRSWISLVQYMKLQLQLIIIFIVNWSIDYFLDLSIICLVDKMSKDGQKSQCFIKS